MEYKDLLTLAKHAIKADASKPVAYSFGGKNYSKFELDGTLQEEFNKLAPDYYSYKENQPKIFKLMAETIEDVLPARVMDQYSQFAEIKTFAQGDKPIFIQRITSASKRRAKQFIGKAGLAGLYEVFKLDGRSYEVTTNAIGAAAQVGWEEMLDGRVTLSELLEIVLEGLDECIYMEIEKQLIGAVKSVQKANYVRENAFVETEMDRLISIAESYGGKATIYCTFEFAATMIPSDARMSDDIKNNLWNNGYLGNYKGHQVIVLRQSYEDEANTVKVIDPSYAWIIPSGSEKPVKIAFEGGTFVDEYKNYDRSQEIQIYKKVGVRAVFSNDICVYQNYSLTRA